MGKYPGEYRHLAGFTRTTKGTIKDYLHQDMIKDATRKLIDIYNSNSSLTLGNIIEFKMDILQIHPFSDGNGRTFRLLLNWMLITNGYTPILIRFEDRDKYIEGLEDYSRFKEQTKFKDFIYLKLINSYKDMLKDNIGIKGFYI